MNFTGNEGEIIDMQEGALMTAQYRDAQPGDNLCVFFGKTLLSELLDQENAKGLRFYFAHNGEGKLTLVTVAADGEGKDIQSKVGNKGPICPNDCCTESPLAN